MRENEIKRDRRRHDRKRKRKREKEEERKREIVTEKNIGITRLKSLQKNRVLTFKFSNNGPINSPPPIPNKALRIPIKRAHIGKV